MLGIDPIELAEHSTVLLPVSQSAAKLRPEPLRRNGHAENAATTDETLSEEVLGKEVVHEEARREEARREEAVPKKVTLETPESRADARSVRLDDAHGAR